MRRVFTILIAFSLGAILTQAQTVYPKGTTVWNPGTYDGYTLFPSPDGNIYLIDMDGTIVNTWSSPIPGDNLSNPDPLDNGNIVVFSWTPGVGSPQSAQVVGELDYDGNVVRFFSNPFPFIPGTDFHHDSERLDNGNTLIMMSQLITVPAISPLPLVDDAIIEVDPSGNVVWAWQTWQHFFDLGFSQEALGLISNKGGDWAHGNSIDVIPANTHTDPAFAEGNIIVSYRLINTILIIDKATGNIAWQLGPEEHETYGQHHPFMIEQGLTGAGNILVFDNGAGTGKPLRKTPAPGFSSVKEIDPVTKTVVWDYDHGDSGLTKFSFFADIVSNAQRMPNGNTVICSGAKGRLFEIDVNDQIVWEYMSPFSSAAGGAESLVVFRAYRLPYTWAPSN